MHLANCHVELKICLFATIIHISPTLQVFHICLHLFVIRTTLEYIVSYSLHFDHCLYKYIFRIYRIKRQKMIWLDERLLSIFKLDLKRSHYTFDARLLMVITVVILSILKYNSYMTTSFFHQLYQLFDDKNWTKTVNICVGIPDWTGLNPLMSDPKMFKKVQAKF